MSDETDYAGPEREIVSEIPDNFFDRAREIMAEVNKARDVANKAAIPAEGTIDIPEIESLRPVSRWLTVAQLGVIRELDKLLLTSMLGRVEYPMHEGSNGKLYVEILVPLDAVPQWLKLLEKK
jgi:hypothetical protein